MSDSGSRPPLSVRVLPWFALVTGGLTAIEPFAIPRITGRPPLPASATIILLILGVGGLISGFFGLRRIPAAYWLLFVLFLVQTVEYFSPSFYFSFIGPFALKLGWGWHSPPSHVNVNVLAIMVCFFAVRAARALTPPRPAQ